MDNNLPIKNSQPIPAQPMPSIPPDLQALMPAGTRASEMAARLGHALLHGLAPMLAYFEAMSPPPVPCRAGCGMNLYGLTEAQVNRHMETHTFRHRIMVKFGLQP